MKTQPMSYEHISRQKFLIGGSSLLLGGLTVPALAKVSEDEALIAHEMKVMGEMASGDYEFLWKILGGITEEELDWRPNKESNPVRWVLGHLCWFEEYFADTLGERKGRYLTDLKPKSINDIPYDEVKKRFDAARKQTAKLIATITPTQLATVIKFVGAFEVSLRVMAQIHISHMSGHTYQIRYIRGTYSRVFKTNKALFDPW
jgi:DinB superfamily